MSHSLVCTPVVAVLCRARVHSPYVYPPSTQRRTMSVSRRSRTTARNKHQPDLEIAGSARMKRRYAHDGIHIRHPPGFSRPTHTHTHLGGTPVQFCSGRSMRGRRAVFPTEPRGDGVALIVAVTVHGQAVVMIGLAYFGIRRADRAWPHKANVGVEEQAAAYYPADGLTLIDQGCGISACVVGFEIFEGGIPFSRMLRVSWGPLKCREMFRWAFRWPKFQTPSWSMQSVVV